MTSLIYMCMNSPIQQFYTRATTCDKKQQTSFPDDINSRNYIVYKIWAMITVHNATGELILNKQKQQIENIQI